MAETCEETITARALVSEFLARYAEACGLNDLAGQLRETEWPLIDGGPWLKLLIEYSDGGLELGSSWADLRSIERDLESREYSTCKGVPVSARVVVVVKDLGELLARVRSSRK